MRLFCKLMLSVLLAASVARAQTPSTDAPAKAEPATPADSAQAAAKGVAHPLWIDTRDLGGNQEEVFAARLR